MRRNSLAAIAVCAVAALGFLARPCAGVDLVRAGKPVAAIVIPAQPLAVESYAARELQYHVRAATGAELKIVSEDERALPADRVYLGHCRKTTEVNLDPSTVPGNGYIFKTVGRSLLLAGHDGPGDALSSDTHAGTLFGVYDLLEQHLGVRWLWPGKLGEVIPSRKALSLPPLNGRVEPRLWFKEWRGGLVSRRWGPGELRDEFSRQQAIWLRRQRFGRSLQPTYGHSFGDYWKRFSKSHPEYFALMPDGTRGPDPLDVAEGAGDNGKLIHMCVSEPALWKQIIEDWKANGAPEFLNICENDGYPGCTCERCLSWDSPDPELTALDYWPYTMKLEAVSFHKRIEAARRAIARKDPYWMLQLGSLSDRYARYSQAVLDLARRVRPDVKVVIYAYDNYRKPPVKPIRMGSNAVFGFVPWAPFPYNRAVSEKFRKEWGVWAATGASIFLRPNYTLDGHNLPVFYARELGQDLKFAMAHSMKGADFDSLTGQYSTQGPTMYMLASILNHPDAGVEAIIDEYCAAFGPAAESVKKYFQHWETVTQRLTMDRVLTLQQAKRKYDNPSFAGLLEGPELFGPELRQGWALLEQARNKAAGDPPAGARVEMLAAGLRHVELVLAAERAYEHGVDSGDRSEFQKAYQELRAFRAQNAERCLSDFTFLNGLETKLWKP